MNELINEIQNNIDIYENSLARNKKHYEYPFSQNCDHYYKLIILQKTLDTWKSCFEVVIRYKKNRIKPIEPFLSEHIKENMEYEIKRYPGILTEKTKYQIIDYMKRLEWKIEELEDKFNSSQQRAK